MHSSISTFSLNVKRLLLLLFSFTLFTFIANAQIDTMWTKTFGGTGNEVVGLTINTNLGSPAASIDTVGNFVYIATASASADMDITSPKGGNDLWVVKLTRNGDLIWQKSIGGTDFDRASKVLSLQNGGCVVVGRTISTDNDASDNHGMTDAIVVEFDADGNVIQKRCVGGSDDDFLYDILLSADGNYVLCGESLSTNGDLAGVGAGLSWIIKLNSTNLSTMWSHTYQSPNTGVDALSNLYRIVALNDGSGYVATGYTTPNFNDFNLDNIYIQKIDLAGNQMWEKQLGSTTTGDYAAAIVDAGNGEFYITAGLSSANGADVTSGYNGGASDYWLLKFNASGTKLWDKNYGGTDWEFAFDMKKDASGNLYLAGFTRSTNLDASRASYGGIDYFVIKTNGDGDTIYTARCGGSANDVAMGLALFNEDDFMLCGKSASPDGGCVHGAMGEQDLWVVRYTNPSASLYTLQQGKPIAFPNPTNRFITIENSAENQPVYLFSATGSCITSLMAVDGTVDLGSYSAGYYLLRGTNSEGATFTLPIQLN